MTKWQLPIRGPQQPAPAAITPLPLEVTSRDIGAPGAPITLTPMGVDHVQRLAAIGASNTHIASALRIGRATFREVCRRQPEVAEALAAGRSILATECTHHLLLAARGGEWQAAAALGKFRLGWDNHAVSSQQGEDMPAAGEESEPEIDWSKVSIHEREWLLLAIKRIHELEGKGALTEHDRCCVSHHTALRLTPHERRLLVGETSNLPTLSRLVATLRLYDAPENRRAAPLLDALLEFVSSVPTPGTLMTSEVEQLCAALRGAVPALGPKRAHTIVESAEEQRSSSLQAEHLPVPEPVLPELAGPKSLADLIPTMSERELCAIAGEPYDETPAPLADDERRLALVAPDDDAKEVAPPGANYDIDDEGDPK